MKNINELINEAMHTDKVMAISKDDLAEIAVFFAEFGEDKAIEIMKKHNKGGSTKSFENILDRLHEILMDN